MNPYARVTSLLAVAAALSNLKGVSSFVQPSPPRPSTQLNLENHIADM